MTHINEYRTLNPNSWVLTNTLQKFWPLDPQPSEVHLQDIASGLGKKCRFSGQCNRFYSIAEHSILASRLVGPDLAREALMHDADEYILPDVCSPIKEEMRRRFGWDQIEERVQWAIWQRFALSAPPHHPKIKEVDRRLVVTERDQNFRAGGPKWDTHVDVAPYPSLEIPFWSPWAAEMKFMERAKELGIL